MAYNLQEFIQDIDPRMINQGKAYYIEGRIQRVSYWKRQYTAEVQGRGSKPYSQVIKIARDGTVESWSCTCPYHAGPVCKHIAAVMMAIADGMATEEEPVPEPAQLFLEQLLTRYPLAEMASLIASHSQEDPVFRTQAILALSTNPEDELQAIQLLLEDTVSRACSRGSIQPQQCLALCQELRMPLERARQHIQRYQYNAALDILLYLLSTALRVNRYTSSHVTALTDFITTVLSLVHKSASEAVYLVEERRPQMRKMLRIAESSDFDGWITWRCSLLRSTAMLSDPNSVQEIYAFLDDLVSKLQDREHSEYLLDELSRARRDITAQANTPQSIRYMEAEEEEGEEEENGEDPEAPAEDADGESAGDGAPF